jgi:ornithine cyclodeaminase/alanine dehydrogenase-like protein (mu-crystallin family)
MGERPAPHFTDHEVESTADLRGVTDELALAFADLGADTAATTVRVRAQAGSSDASAMAAIYPRRGVGGGKLYLNAKQGRSFLIALFSDDGRLLATFDGEAITAERTAAATALGIRRMARPDSTVGALFGTGVQATWQALAVAQEVPLTELRIVGRTPEKTAAIVEWCIARGIPARSTDAREAVDGADVVVAVTATYEPLFDGAWLAERALVCGVGSTKAARRELDGTTVSRSSIVVTDSVEGARTEAGDLIQAAAEGIFDWGQLRGLDEIMADPSVSMPASGIRLFESQGVAIEDVVGAWHAFSRLGGPR